MDGCSVGAVSTPSLLAVFRRNPPDGTAARTTIIVATINEKNTAYERASRFPFYKYDERKTKTTLSQPPETAAAAANATRPLSLGREVLNGIRRMDVSIGQLTPLRQEERSLPAPARCLAI